ncbi:MAG: HAMP domain-containing histidine kinase [Lachnospiraceae bacterium]
MKFSLRTKFLLSYAVIIVTSLIILNTYGVSLVYDKILDKAKTSLYNEASLISEKYLAGPYITSGSTMITLKHYFSSMQKITEARIIVTSPDSRIIIDSDKSYNSEGEFINNYDKNFLSYQTITETNISSIFPGKSVAVIYPVTESMETLYYIILSRELKPLQNQAVQYTDAIVLCYITFTTIIMVILFYLYIQTVIPVQLMAKAARKYADGQFDYPITVIPGNEQSELAGAIKYMANKMSDMDNYQRKFIANVSHDFRSPLTSIKGYTQALLDGTIPPEMQGKYLDIILFETERLSKLTSSLLTLGQFENGSVPMDISTFDINYEIKRCSAAFEQRCTEKQISLELTFEAKSLMVQADLSKIEQVIQNLVDNAVKFSHHNSVIEIHTARRNTKAFVSIKDHGIGIPKDSINKVWDRFYKTDISRGKDKKGTGLGLSITKEIIESHGENINVISTEGVGTEFIFSLPAPG